MGDFGGPEVRRPEEVRGRSHPHTDQVAAGADLVGLMEFTFELADRHPGELGQLGYIKGGGEVVLDELRRGFDLEERLEQGFRAFVAADRAADPAGATGLVEERDLGGLIPDVFAFGVGEELDDARQGLARLADLEILLLEGRGQLWRKDILVGFAEQAGLIGDAAALGEG